MVDNYRFLGGTESKMRIHVIMIGTLLIVISALEEYLSELQAR